MRSLILPLATAGATRFIFQFESLFDSDDDQSDVAVAIEKAIRIAHDIRIAGMRCGICISPNTAVEKIRPILEAVYSEDNNNNNNSPLIELVDILAVNPGIGGQQFNKDILDKISQIRRNYPALPYIAVDGGINESTAQLAIDAGANILIAGSFVFGNNRSYSDGVFSLKEQLMKLIKICRF